MADTYLFSSLFVVMQRVLLPLLFFLLSAFSPALAQQWIDCKVVNVADGDTITCLHTSWFKKTSLKIRLDQIDAPERKQPFGNKARIALRDKINQRIIKVEIRGTDRYKRTIGTLYLNGENINKWLVANGHAWAYRRYLKDKDYLRLEQEARQAKKGLWIDGDRAIYPEDYRQNQRQKK